MKKKDATPVWGRKNERSYRSSKADGSNDQGPELGRGSPGPGGGRTALLPPHGRGRPELLRPHAWSQGPCCPTLSPCRLPRERDHRTRARATSSPSRVASLTSVDTIAFQQHWRQAGTTPAPPQTGSKGQPGPRPSSRS